MQTGAATVGNSMEIPKTFKMELPLDPVIPLLGLYPKEPKTLIRKNMCSLMFIAALLTTAKTWKQPKCPSVDEWTKKLWYIYTVEDLLCRKRGTLTFCDSVGKPRKNYAK